jgi:DNA-directed RNA polymerase II subunit RPB2
MENADVWKIIRKHFEDNPQCLVRHHIDSYNHFFKKDIYQIFKDSNPLKLQVNYDKATETYKQECLMYLGGKEGNKIYFGKPIIYDEDTSHYMFPNEARLRDMTYGMTIHYDVDVEFTDILDEDEEPAIVGGDNTYIVDNVPYQHGDIVGGNEKKDKKKRKKKQVEEVSAEQSVLIKEQTAQSVEEDIYGRKVQRRTLTMEKVYLGRFPVMLQSDYCILHELPREMRFNMGECKNDLGGYFIIDGKEKTVVPQEKFGNNMMYIREDGDEKYLYSAEIRSVSENVSKPVRTLAVKLQAPNATYSQKNIVVAIPNVRKPVPLFIVFRALGILSDKEIVEYCLLDREKYSHLEDLLVPSVYDAGNIFTQQQAIDYIRLLTKGGTVEYVMEILADYFLPHIGELNFNEKAYFLGHIVLKLLLVFNGNEPLTDRDNYKFKRVELVGSMMYDLFREYYKIQLHNIHLGFEENITFQFGSYGEDLYELVRQKHSAIFGERLLEEGFRKAFKGDWGAYSHTKRIGALQDLNRLSSNSAKSHLRKTNLPLDATAKVVGPRLLNATQWGMFDPIDTPDGGNIGIHKHLSIATYVTESYSREELIEYLHKHFHVHSLDDHNPLWVSKHARLFINGYWVGCVDSPFEIVETMKLHRRLGLIPIYTSISFDIQEQTVYFYTDGGRVCRPIFYKDGETKKMSFENGQFQKQLKDNNLHWNDFVLGMNERKREVVLSDNKFYEIEELYEITPDEKKDNEGQLIQIKRFHKNKAVIDYIDTNETEQALIALSYEELENTSAHTHMEIHESLIFGMMCNLINFPENNPATRNSFSCGQSKQACSLYHTNYNMRMDKTAVLLNYGQVPLVKSRYLEFIDNEENPYGENTIVAIMCYTGYNVEDAVLINQGSLHRGLFRTTYFSTYASHEEKSKVSSNITQKKFVNIESQNDVVGTKTGYDYSMLDEYGIIREGTEVNDKTVLIGMVSRESEESEKYVDESKTTKKGQLGIVDKTFITDNEEGKRIAKVRVLEQRIPAIGDKLASRAGQKGTVGLVVKECDMPFTKDGIRPDLIINPHAIPSRMTIGHLVECITGKAAVLQGGYGDCTAFQNKGSKVQVFGNMLNELGYHSSGNEILYNGMDGTQIESEIFMGPNYYMRLKHMVKDKINYRAQGPRTALTHQAVSGRANDGGLRIGEMERDSVISHGAAAFLNESMMERGDKYYFAVCNKTGMMSVYNPEKNIMLSPMADGPVQYSGSLNSDDFQIQQMSKYGRDFSIICVPYTFKLLMQELQTINVQMRIITEDTIDQVGNMSFSKNIHKLMYMPEADDTDVINKLQKSIQERLKDVGAFPTLDVTSKDEQPSMESTLPEKDDKSPTDPDELYKYIYGTPSPVGSEEKPVFSPRTPEGSPVDGPWDSLKQEASKYSVGDQVFYLKDEVENRLWNITNIDEHLITIKLDSGYVGPMASPSDSSTTIVTTAEYIRPRPESPPMPSFGVPQTTPSQNSNESMLETRAKEYSIGDEVIYLKDKKNLLWKIVDIDGKFLTIELDTNFVGQSEIALEMDTVQVVTVMDIKPRPESPQMPPMGMTTSGGNTMTYAPVININTGGNAAAPTVETSNTQAGGNVLDTTQSNGNVLENPVANSTEKNNEKSEEKSGGGMFDFSNFIIKKMI